MMNLLYQAYLNNGASAGNPPAVLRAMHIIEEMGPALSLYITLPNVNSSAVKATPLSHQP